jgi:hypothetical protein
MWGQTFFICTQIISSISNTNKYYAASWPQIQRITLLATQFYFKSSNHKLLDLVLLAGAGWW